MLKYSDLAEEDIDNLPLSMPLWPDGAQLFGMSRMTAYRAVWNGTFPCKVIKVGPRWRVLTWSALEVLKGRAA